MTAYALDNANPATPPLGGVLIGVSWFDVAAGEKKPLVLDLDALGRSSGSATAIVRGVSDAASGWAKVAPAQDPEDLLCDEGSANADAEGRIRFKGLPPGEYVVRAHAVNDKREASARVTVAAGEEHEVEITFP
jgi:hypothetical protein